MPLAMKKALSFLLAAAVILVHYPDVELVSAGADTHNVLSGTETDRDFYIYHQAEYLERGYQNAGTDGSQAILSQTSGSDKTPEVKRFNNTDYIQWNDNNSYLEWKLSVPEDGLYNLEIRYILFEDTETITPVRGIQIDGKTPFSEAENIQLPVYYQDIGKPKTNNMGDEIQPQIKVVAGEYSHHVFDVQGLYSQPLAFYLEAGEHILRLNYVVATLNISGVKFVAPKKYQSYQEYIKQQGGVSGAANIEPVTYQAEGSVKNKNDLALNMQSSGDAACYPKSIKTRKLNVMGEFYWRSGGQSITWEFTVPQDGFYQINMRMAQYWNDGISSYRQIAINGEVPFSEMLCYEFQYNRRWRKEVIADEKGDPYLFYLKAGVTNTLTMTVMLGDLSPLVVGLYEDAYRLSAVVHDIIKITGVDPDPNYNYQLDVKKPDIIVRLNQLSVSIISKVNYLKMITTKKSAAANNLQYIAKQLAEIARKPDTIHLKIVSLTDVQGTIGNWFQDLQYSPLVIDYFTYCGRENTVNMKMANFFDTSTAILTSFINSYFKDYSALYDTDMQDENSIKTIDVWSSHGRDWAELIKQLADEYYTPESKVAIKMNILPSSQLNTGSINALMLSIASNKQPDVALGIDRNSPVEFAIRSAVVDLRKFEDFDVVANRFAQGSLLPFSYRDGIYALPETTDFKVLFYRADVFQELGLKVPDTWGDLYDKIMPILSANNMQVYIPQDYSLFLFQYGGEFYTQDGKRSALDQPEAIQAFEEYCELFTDYGVPVQADFYMRMRTGQIPIGIGGFGDYIKLLTAAPELQGKWAIAPLPAHYDENGIENRTAPNIVASADMLLSGSSLENEAWDFISWWNSYETQSLFGRLIEAKFGKQARWNTANIQAFNALPWEPDDLKVINRCFGNFKETPVVLGGYITGRNIANAWNNVVLNQYYPRYELNEAVDDINRELLSKQKQYN